MPQVTKGVPSGSNTMRGAVIERGVESTTIESDHRIVVCAARERLERSNTRWNNLNFIHAVIEMLVWAIFPVPGLVHFDKAGEPENTRMLNLLYCTIIRRSCGAPFTVIFNTYTPGKSVDTDRTSMCSPKVCVFSTTANTCAPVRL